jgi:hypothetical protein
MIQAYIPQEILKIVRCGHQAEYISVACTSLTLAKENGFMQGVNKTSYVVILK